MGWANHHDDHESHEPQRRHVDPSQSHGQQQILRYIAKRCDGYANDRSDYGEVAREVSDRFGVLLTPGEVKDMHRSGKW